MPHAWEAGYPPGCRWDVPIAEGTRPGSLDHAAARFGILNLPTALEIRDTLPGGPAGKFLATALRAGTMGAV
jgi:hypothetical protein